MASFSRPVDCFGNRRICRCIGSRGWLSLLMGLGEPRGKLQRYRKGKSFPNGRIGGDEVGRDYAGCHRFTFMACLRQDQGYSASMTNLCLVVMRQMLGLTVFKGLIAFNPANEAQPHIERHDETKIVDRKISLHGVLVMHAEGRERACRQLFKLAEPALLPQSRPNRCSSGWERIPSRFEIAIRRPVEAHEASSAGHSIPP